jgi:magnesium transporter
MTVITYSEHEYAENTLEKVEDCFPSDKKPAVTWINVRGIHDIEKISSIGSYLKLHPLTLEDILNTDQRPKYEDSADYILIVLEMLSHNDTQDVITSDQVSLILGADFVVSFLENEDPFGPVRKRIQTPNSLIRKMKADYLAYSLVDLIVDNYFAVIEKIGDRIETVEEELVTNPDAQTLRAIHGIKNELVLLRKSTWPVREIINAMDRSDSNLIRKSIHIYLRDIYDHIVQVIDNIESLRDIISGMLDIYLSSISNRTNAVMKVLTIIATIFIPLTFMVGIYGMNFKYMPELDLTWSYPVLLLIMALIAVVMIIYFKRKKWL